MKCDYCGKPIENQPYVIKGDKRYHLEPCQHELVAQGRWEPRLLERTRFLGKLMKMFK